MNEVQQVADTSDTRVAMFFTRIAYTYHGIIDKFRSRRKWRSYIESGILPLLAVQVGTFDSIITVFFLDTAPVVIEYIEAISR